MQCTTTAALEITLGLPSLPILTQMAAAGGAYRLLSQENGYMAVRYLAMVKSLRSFMKK